MELGVRDWMIIIGVLLILAVLLDGYRRMRNDRRGNIRISLNKQFLNSVDADDEITSELPSGGARIIGQRRASSNDDTPSLGDGMLGDDFGERMTSTAGVDLDLDQPVPMLMESVSGAAESDQYEPAQPVPELAAEPEPEPEPESESVADEPDEPVVTSMAEIEEVVVINVVAKNQPFKGPDLLHILLACDLRYGDRHIFHRHEEANGRGAVQFSVANSVEPGIFDLDNIDDFTTPGVCFFMSVPGPKQSIKAFEFMVETAQCVVTNLDGELLDDSRSAMTNQTLEHCRLRLQEFERRQLTQHA